MLRALRSPESGLVGNWGSSGTSSLESELLESSLWTRSDCVDVDQEWKGNVGDMLLLQLLVSSVGTPVLQNMSRTTLRVLPNRPEERDITE